MNFTEEEVLILQDFENGTLAPSLTDQEALQPFVAAAKAYGKKTKPVQIRLSEQDLHDLQVIAVQKGLSYQTLIGSILHSYVSAIIGGQQKPQSATGDLRG